MTKKDFVRTLNQYHFDNNLTNARDLLLHSTKLGERVCKELIRHNWEISKRGSFGTNIFHFLECCLEDDTIDYSPIIKKDAYFYVKYLDNHAAAYALINIKKYSPTLSNHG